MSDDAETFTLDGEELELAKALAALLILSGRTKLQQFLIVASLPSLCGFEDAMDGVVDIKVNE